MDKYILDGKRLVKCENLLEWAKHIESDSRCVARTKIKDTLISTVFLGIDHSFNDKGPPILFETAVFVGRCALGQEIYRHETWEEAVKVHREIIARVKKET